MFFASAIFFWIVLIITLKKFGNVVHGKKYFETRVVMDKGVYSLTRHPQYLAYLFLVSGFAFILQNWIIYLIAVLAMAMFYMQSIEEKKRCLGNIRRTIKSIARRWGGLIFLKISGSKIVPLSLCLSELKNKNILYFGRYHCCDKF